MINDIICECLVKKKLNAVRIVEIVTVFGGGFFLSIVLYALIGGFDPSGMLGPSLFLVGIFLTVFFGRHLITVEYEYAYFDGEISFDRITAKSKRKHLTNVSMKSVEKIGRPGDSSIERLKVTRTRNYSSSIADKDTIFIYFKDTSTGDNVLLYFTPNQKMLDAMKTTVSATVYREAFSKTKKN